ncbi:hypothetical protein U1Q18_049483 [Sarracenia purpurea var. burkii]
MKVIIFASIVCLNFVRIKAPYSRPRNELLGRYPIQENVGQNSNDLSSEPVRRLPNYPFPSVSRPPAFPPSPQIPPQITSQRFLESSTTSFPPLPRPYFAQGDSDRNSVQSDGGICTRRGGTLSNSNLNQIPRPSAAASIPNSSTLTSSPPVEPDQLGNRSIRPEALKDVSQGEKNEPSKDETDGSENSKQSSKNQPGEEEWEGPKTPEEDKPELYTTSQNVKFVGENTIASSPSNNGPLSDQEMPSFVAEILTSPRYSSNFRTLPRNGNDQNSPSHYGQYFNGNRPDRPMPPYMNQQPSFPRSSRSRGLPTFEDFPYSDGIRRNDRIFEESGPWPMNQNLAPFNPLPPLSIPILPPVLLARRYPVLQLQPRPT